MILRQTKIVFTYNIFYAVKQINFDVLYTGKKFVI